MIVIISAHKLILKYNIGPSSQKEYNNLNMDNNDNVVTDKVDKHENKRQTTNVDTASVTRLQKLL